MQITTVQWNIGGGKVRAVSDAVDVLASYNNDGFDEIIELLQIHKPDIITLQEIHADSISNQAESIAKVLGLQYIVSDFYADSHIEAGQRLGQAIISRYPIAKHNFELFLNPHYEAIWEDGSKALSHDKGVTSCAVDIDGVTFDVKTLHLIPFRRFNVDPKSKEAKLVLEDIADKLRSDGSNILIQGDFNLDFSSLMEILPTFMQNLDEVIQDLPTNPKGRKLDHVVFRGLSLESSSPIASVLTDHYPVISKFLL